MGLLSTLGSYFGPLGTGLGAIGDYALGKSDAQETNSATQAYQREMRQTAYQDTTKDLVAAGLNPMLAYSNGPTTSAAPNLQNKGLSAAQQSTTNSAGSLAQAQKENVEADTVNKQSII